MKCGTKNKSIFQLWVELHDVKPKYFELFSWNDFLIRISSWWFSQQFQIDTYCIQFFEQFDDAQNVNNAKTDPRFGANTLFTKRNNFQLQSHVKNSASREKYFWSVNPTLCLRKVWKIWTYLEWIFRAASLTAQPHNTIFYLFDFFSLSSLYIDKTFSSVVCNDLNNMMCRMIRTVSSNGNENIITENLLRCFKVSHMNLIRQNERFYRNLTFRLQSDLCAMRCQWTKYLLVRFYEFMFYIPPNSHYLHSIRMKKKISCVYKSVSVFSHFSVHIR